VAIAATWSSSTSAGSETASCISDIASQHELPRQSPGAQDCPRMLYDGEADV
jgi:hypothetical protein